MIRIFFWNDMDGFHTVPRRNLSGPIFAMAGSPFANRNRQIRNTARTEAQAATINTIFMACSLNLFIQDSSSLQLSGCAAGASFICNQCTQTYRKPGTNRAPCSVSPYMSYLARSSHSVVSPVKIAFT